MLSHSTWTKTLLPDFRWWVLKDVDYRGNVFQDPPDPCLCTAVFESYKYSAGSQWTDRQTRASHWSACPLLAQQAAPQAA